MHCGWLTGSNGESSDRSSADGDLRCCVGMVKEGLVRRVEVQVAGVLEGMLDVLARAMSSGRDGGANDRWTSWITRRRHSELAMVRGSVRLLPSIMEIKTSFRGQEKVTASII